MKLFLQLLLALALEASSFVRAVPPYDRAAAARSLAVLFDGASGGDAQCLAVLIAPAFVVTPAHCVEQTRVQGRPVAFAAFGFVAEPLRDDDTGELPTAGSPRRFAALFVDRSSLALTWHSSLQVDNALETCGLSSRSASDSATLVDAAEPVSSSSSSQSSFGSDAGGAEEPEPLVPIIAGDVVCMTAFSGAASFPDPSSQLGSLLLYEHGKEPGYLVAGFGASHADLPLTRSFTWAEATGPEFLGRPLIDGARWIHIPPMNLIIGGYVPPRLDENLQFVTGIRTTRKGANYCGGSLIAPTFVLTAAHCMAGGDPQWVSVGSLMAAGGDFGEQIRVARVLQHPAYDRATMANDLALVELRYASVAAPVRLFNSAPVPAGGVILGYGATTPTGITLSDVLRFVDVAVVASRGQCAADLQLELDASMFCAGGRANKDACDGDSGGPLMVTTSAVLGRALSTVPSTLSVSSATTMASGESNSGSETALVGVISFGRGCGAEFLPGVYANVSAGFDFIMSVTPDATWTTPVPPRGIVAPGGPGSHSSGTGTGTGSVGSGHSGAAGKHSGSSGGGGRSGSGGASGGAGGVGGESPRTPSIAMPGGDGATIADPSAHTTYEFELPSELSPSLRAAVAAFLVGEHSQISFMSAESLLARGRIVFRSSATLSALERLIESHDAKPLHRRTRRSFTSTATADSTSEWC
ncbi:hypothetical protein PybrP1_000915 [[Pythium] brassicae (nom. inval.)]|nr:hypothetical protein PybrP1_000915 [[Pythium] brassicae (nom. inval.)]